MSLRTTDVWEQYGFYTRDLTENGRKLAFAGAAICWILKEDATTFPYLVVWAFLFVVGFFLFDILQYAWGAGSNFFLARATEEEYWSKASRNARTEAGIPSLPVDKPDWMDKPMRWMLTAKTASLGVAFLLLFVELYCRL